MLVRTRSPFICCCTHTREAHEHFHRATYCSKCACDHFRYSSWRHWMVGQRWARIFPSVRSLGQ